ncbi:MAG: hypothetical protein WBW38_00970 [Candidatus Sulfotelmatobacter sp.]
MTFKKWLCSSLLAAVSVAPVFVFAGTNDAADAKNTPSANTANADATATPNPAPSPALAVGDANVTALLGVLVMKGILSAPEANAVRNAAPNAQFQALVEALTRKGVVSAADLSAISNPAQPSTTPLTVAALPVVAATSAQRQEVAQNPPQKKPAAPNVVPAVAPLRVLAVDPPVKDGLVPSFKVGAVKVTPYGFIKATVVHDSSDPNGDDFPFPGIFLNSSTALSTGPTQDPSFHIKARS